MTLDELELLFAVTRPSNFHEILHYFALLGGNNG